MPKSDDIRIAEMYLAKRCSATDRKIEFDLSFDQYKKLLNVKVCGYTGIKLTPGQKNKTLRMTDRTIDRLDSSKGYTAENCIVCSHGANQFKGYLENPNNNIDIAAARGILDRMEGK